MFWIFRKKKPLKPAWYYLDIASGILQVRGKAQGRTYDEHGRVDVMGAMRIAVWGALEWDQVRQSWRFDAAAHWQKYDEVKTLMHQYLHAHHPQYMIDPSCNRNRQASHLFQWSDSTDQDVLIDSMRGCARLERLRSIPIRKQGV